MRPSLFTHIFILNGKCVGIPRNDKDSIIAFLHSERKSCWFLLGLTFVSICGGLYALDFSFSKWPTETLQMQDALGATLANLGESMGKVSLSIMILAAMSIFVFGLLFAAKTIIELSKIDAALKSIRAGEPVDAVSRRHFPERASYEFIVQASINGGDCKSYVVNIERQSMQNAEAAIIESLARGNRPTVSTDRDSVVLSSWRFRA